MSATDYTLAFPTVKAMIISCLEFVVRFYWVIQIGRDLVDFTLDTATLVNTFNTVSGNYLRQQIAASTRHHEMVKG